MCFWKKKFWLKCLFFRAAESSWKHSMTLKINFIKIHDKPHVHWSLNIHFFAVIQASKFMPMIKIDWTHTHTHTENITLNIQNPINFNNILYRAYPSFFPSSCLFTDYSHGGYQEIEDELHDHDSQNMIPTEDPFKLLTNLKRLEPYFDPNVNQNVTALVGKSAYLNCVVKNLANKTVE